LDHKLTAYLTASASVGVIAVSEAEAVVVSNTTVQPFGINGDVNIDFNSDGQIDYQIDHDRVNLNGNDLDYLQVDKNDASSAQNPYPIDNFGVFGNPATPNADHEYATDAGAGERGYYPSALLSGAEIGPLTNGWDFQEGENFIGSHRIIRANRLIDEDATQIDNANPNPPPEVVGTFVPFGSPGWIGLGGQTRYLGMRIDLNDAGHDGFNNNASQYWYAWIGVRITNEADATGEVVGWGYETEIGMPILAGETGTPVGLDGDYNEDGKVDAADYVVWRKTDGTPAGFNLWRSNFGEMAGVGAGVTTDAGASAVPEPSSLLLGLPAAIAMVCAFVFRRSKRS
jgi:hypothetical protein